ncbi:hypothetical protein EDB19DRAFT_378890 [Suillus lakei]|nr:hypothetical protein EDB19DRAFT_378890 [Suillus lakei]
MPFANTKQRFKHNLTCLLLLTVFGQTVIVSFAWGFTGALLFEGVVTLPDNIVHLIVEYHTVLTLIVTLISTVLSIITSDRRISYRVDTDSNADLNCLVDHHLHVRHFHRQRSPSSPPLSTSYIVQAPHCNSAEYADLGMAMEIPQAVGPHIGGLCGGCISEHELEYLAPAYPCSIARGNVWNGTGLGIYCICQPVERGPSCLARKHWNLRLKPSMS